VPPDPIAGGLEGIRGLFESDIIVPENTEVVIRIKNQGNSLVIRLDRGQKAEPLILATIKAERHTFIAWMHNFADVLVFRKRPDHMRKKAD